VEGRKRCGKKRAEEKRRTRKKGINICGVGKKTEGLTANFTLAVYIQFLVAADISRPISLISFKAVRLSIPSIWVRSTPVIASR
jgi:hypothetical protein